MDEEDGSSEEGEYTLTGEKESDEKYLDYGLDGEVRVASPYVFFVYYFLILGVQMFMSYDGGAVNATNVQLKQNTGMTDNELDILQAIDKFAGFAGVLWQMMFPIVPTKLLLLIGLGMNTFGSSMFAWCNNKWLLIMAKFIQGASEALQQVWGTAWTLKNAPPAQKHWWVSAGGAIGAGVGNMIGMAVGWSAPSYHWAYWVQSSILSCFWLLLLFTPTRLVAAPGLPKEKKAESTMFYIRQVYKHVLYNCTLWTVILSSFNTAILMNTAQRFFQLGPWPMPAMGANYIQAIMQVSTALGFIIVQVLFTRRGGGDDTVGTYVRVHTLMQMQMVAVFSAGLAAAALGARMVSGPYKANAPNNHVESDPLLWVLVTFCQPLLAVNQGIDAVTPEVNYVSIITSDFEDVVGRADISNFAVSLTRTGQNLGNAFGAMLPGWLISLLAVGVGTIPNSYEYAFRYGICFCLTVPMVLLLLRAMLFTQARVDRNNPLCKLQGPEEGVQQTSSRSLELAAHG